MGRVRLLVLTCRDNRLLEWWALSHVLLLLICSMRLSLLWLVDLLIVLVDLLHMVRR